MLRDTRGVTVIEFAIVAPVLILLIMGLGELAYRVYVQSVLTGAVEQAGRDSAIEDADTDTIDATVRSMVLNVAPKATFTPTRLNYDNYSAVAPETFTDSNKNGKYDKGECFLDTNGNGSWDADPGVSGQGTANDVTFYTMTVIYPHLFPTGMIGMGATQTIAASTILKNQPYRSQTTTTVVQKCS